MKRAQSLLLLLITAAFAFWKYFSYETSKGPIRPPLPPAADQRVENLLKALEIELQRQQPGLLESLRASITDKQLDQAQSALGLQIHSEMQVRYRWHNGSVRGTGFFLGYDFYGWCFLQLPRARLLHLFSVRSQPSCRGDRLLSEGRRSGRRNRGLRPRTADHEHVWARNRPIILWRAI